MRQDLLISVDEWESRCALLEDGRAVEIFIERPDSGPAPGDIYLGKVVDVLPGMEASFIDIGESRNAFFFYGHEAYFMPTGGEALPLDVLRKGQRLLVEVSKSPLGDKGARVTAQISLAGRYVIAIPFTSSVAVSRRLSDQQRRRLSELGKELRPAGMGLIIRTAAAEVEPELIKAELKYLESAWKEIRSAAKRRRPPALIRRDVSLPLRLVRDVVREGFETITVDSTAVHDEVRDYLMKWAPHLLPKLKLYLKDEPLFTKYRVDAALQEALLREVRLVSGGKIAIDHTEALTAIDVNTGRFVGKGNLEDTVLRVNLEAAEEIVRQIRLRDLGGIIVIDFIDMRKASHRQKVYDAFMAALERDRVKSQVVEISKMGLIEMTRKKTGEDLPRRLSEFCPVCGGSGRIVSQESRIITSMRYVRELCRTTQSESLLVKLNPEVASRLLRDGGRTWVDPRSGKAVFILSEEGLSLDEVVLVKSGRADEIRSIAEGKNARSMPMLRD